MSRTRALPALVAVAAILLGGTTLVAQTADLSGDVLLRALLEEIRGLRISLQKNSAYELRGRLLIDRARLHQETIRELAREVEQMAEFMRSEEHNTEIMYEAEPMDIDARVATMSPEDRRKMAERQKQAIERRKEMAARHREQARMRYQRMENRLAEEREKLRLIEEELAQIQRELTAATR